MSPLLRRILEPVVDVLSTALIILIIAGMAALLSLLGCAGPTRTVTVMQATLEHPLCIAVLGPPPAPPMEYRELPRCAFPGVAPDEMCLTAEQANILARFAAQAQLYAISAYRACAVSDVGISGDVRILP